MLHFRVLPVVILGSLLLCGPVLAEPIVVSGSANVGATTAGSISIAGEGFALTGMTVSGIIGGVNPSLGCCFAPGAALDLRAFWFSGNLFGTEITLGGETFPLGTANNPAATVVLEFTSTFTLPTLVTGPTAVESPFLFTGFVSRPVPSGPTVRADLIGSGTATLTLGVQPGLDVWSARNLQFQFDDTAPIPEPATMLLVGTGLAAAYRVRRRRAEEQHGTRAVPAARLADPPE